MLILLSGLCLGLQKSGELRKREEALLELKQLIQRFRTEIHYTMRPLGELIARNQEFRLCGLAAGEPCFFASPKEALEQAGKKLFREPSDAELCTGFVKGLGESDSQGQMEHLNLYSELLETHLLQAGEAREKKSRLYICFGLFGAITLCLLMV